MNIVFWVCLVTSRKQTQIKQPADPDLDLSYKDLKNNEQKKKILFGPVYKTQRVADARITKRDFKAVLGIRIRRLTMFLRLPDAHPDPLVASMDPAPNPSIFKQKSRKTMISFYCFVYLLYDFLSLKNDVVSVPNPDSYRYVFRPPGSVSGSVSQRYGSEEIHTKNVTDPQHCFQAKKTKTSN
jgi:hypothetical protein